MGLRGTTWDYVGQDSGFLAKILFTQTFPREPAHALSRECITPPQDCNLKVNQGIRASLFASAPNSYAPFSLQAALIRSLQLAFISSGFFHDMRLHGRVLGPLEAAHPALMIKGICAQNGPISPKGQERRKICRRSAVDLPPLRDIMARGGSRCGTRPAADDPNLQWFLDA